MRQMICPLAPVFQGLLPQTVLPASVLAERRALDTAYDHASRLGRGGPQAYAVRLLAAGGRVCFASSEPGGPFQEEEGRGPGLSSAVVEGLLARMNDALPDPFRRLEVLLALGTRADFPESCDEALVEAVQGCAFQIHDPAVMTGALRRLVSRRTFRAFEPWTRMSVERGIAPDVLARELSGLLRDPSFPAPDAYLGALLRLPSNEVAGAIADILDRLKNIPNRGPFLVRLYRCLDLTADRRVACLGRVWESFRFEDWEEQIGYLLRERGSLRMAATVLARIARNPSFGEWSRKRGAADPLNCLIEWLERDRTAERL